MFIMKDCTFGVFEFCEMVEYLYFWYFIVCSSLVLNWKDTQVNYSVFTISQKRQGFL